MDQGRKELLKFYAWIRRDLYNFIRACGIQDLTFQQLELTEAVRAGESKIAVRSGQGPGKCPHGDEVVWERRRGRVAVRELDGESFETLSKDAYGKLVWRKAACRKNQVKHCVEIATDSGNSVKISSDHKVFTDRGWVPAGDVLPTDLMCVPRSMREILHDEETMTSDELTLAGYLVGDGCTTTHSTSFSQKKGPVLDNARRIIESLGGNIRKRKHGTYDYGISGIGPWVKALGVFGCKSTHKRVPPQVYCNGERGISAFLAALWECDGYAGKDGYGICLANKPLVLDIQALLQALGMASSVRYKKSKCEGKEFEAWRLEVSGVDDLRVWMSTIGSIRGKSSNPDLLTKEGNSNKDIVPIRDKEAKEIAEELGVTVTSLRSIQFRGRRTSYMHRKSFERFVERTGYSGKHAYLASSDIRWVRVTEVKDIGHHQTYDVSVEDTHNFVCSNLVVHNTFSSSLIGLWRSIRHENAKLIVTAPTMAQCRDVWLAQAQKHVTGPGANPLLKRIFKFTGTGYGVMGKHQKMWGCLLKTASKSEGMRGQHETNMDIIVEEASGCDDEILVILQGTQKNKNGLFLQIGNPSRREGYFFDSFHSESHRWLPLHWNAEETPDSPWYNQEDNRTMREQFGRQSDYYRINVLGEFPKADPDSIIPEDRLLWCLERNRLENIARIRNNGKLITQIGVDYARFGSDESVAAYRRGNAVFRLDPYFKEEPTFVTRKVFARQRMLGWTDKETLYVPDAVGIGQGVLGMYYEAGKKVNEFHPSKKPANRKMFADANTEAWFCLREKIRKGLFWMPGDKVAVRQLVTRKYYVDKHSRLVAQSKEDYRDDGKRPSPDRADAIVQSMWDDASQFARIS